MRKITLFVALLFGFSLIAQTADTTFVTTQKIELDYFDDFDSTLNFPDGEDSYRQIIMTVNLGQYDCDADAEYCHQWDYVTNIQLLGENDEIYELGRLVTPFATAAWPRFGSDWEQPYAYDVTDFYPLLRNDKEIRIHYDGYSGGFTAEIEFAFIEGTPEREVLDIKPVYQMHQTYGDESDPINNHLNTFTDTPPEGTEEASMQVIVTGHGSDGTEQCCEFSSHYYDVLVDGTSVDQVDVWKDDCGENDLYPQGGTWVHDRANWCPGEKVEPFHHHLDVTAETEYDLNLEFEEYSGSGELGSYFINGLVFYYGETYKETDAAITDILNPTDDPNHFRANPNGNKPTIKVKNTGNTTLTSMEIEYGVSGYADETYNWSGTLESMEETEIELSSLEALQSLSEEAMEELQTFEVEIVGVNGDEDNDAANNYLSSTFEPAPNWPAELIVNMETSNLNVMGMLNSGKADVSWKIMNMDGNEMEKRDNADVSSTYNDTVNLQENGFYKLKLKSTNCFGLNWWALEGQGFQGGNFKVTSLNGNGLSMKNYNSNTSATDHDDWGCSYTHYFYADAENQSVDKIAKQDFKVFPNPAVEYLNIVVSGNAASPYEISLVDLQGRIMHQQKMKGNQMEIPVNHLSEGVYLLMMEEKGNSKRVEKVIIGK